MRRKRSFLRWLVLACGGLLALLGVLALVGYLFFHVAGGRRAESALALLKASGAPTTWEEAIPPPIPDDENAAVLYELAFAHMQMPSSGTRDQDALYAHAYNDRSERARTAKRAARILADNAEALRVAAEAGKRPKFRPNGDWREPTLVWLTREYHRRWRDLSLLARAQALLQADRGDTAAALQAWSTNVAMLNHLGSDPTLLGQLTRWSVVRLSHDSLRVLLQDSRLTPDDCRRAANDLARLDFSEAFIRALETERASDRWCMELVRTDPRAAFGSSAASAGRVAGVYAAGKGALLGAVYPVMSPLDEAALLEYWERRITLARKPYRETAQQLNALARDVPRYALFTHDFRGPRPELPEWDSMRAASRDGTIAHVGLMRVGLGLAAYRTQFGGYPESLDQLRQALKWEVPEDPFSGKDFVYRRDGKGYLLYSLGRDLDDDGGREANLGNPAQPGTVDRDIVWRVAR